LKLSDTHEKRINDTLRYYISILAKPDYFESIVPIKNIQDIAKDSANEKYLVFQSQLSIVYAPKNENTYRESWLSLINREAIEISENGYYDPPLNLIASGFWGTEEKIANILPLNFMMVQ